MLMHKGDKMKRQTICYTSIKRIVIFSVIAAIVLAAAVAVFTWLVSIEAPFFDENAVTGSPADLLNDNETYRLFQAQNICDAALCELPEVTDGKDVHLFLTNPETNSVYIRAEIYTVAFVRNKDGQVTDYYHDELLGKTGFIRPGEYVETLVLDDSLDAAETYAMIKIATYNIDDGTSNGTFFVNTILYNK
jgi:hypothetical protein